MSLSIAVALRSLTEQVDHLVKANEALAARVSTLEQAPKQPLSLKASGSASRAAPAHGG